jgi:hypothetical protein
MKAIQIKYLPPTDTLGSRWKVWADGVGSITEHYDYAFNNDVQVEALANDFAQAKWNIGIMGIGTLPNGNYVALLSND